MDALKTSGNRSTWKMHCSHDGETMTGEGEFTGGADHYTGTTRMHGRAGGEVMDMTTRFSGKRVGPACESSENRMPSRH